MDTKRLNDFIDKLPLEVDAAIILSPTNKRYLTGVFTEEAGTLIVTRKKAYFIIDSRYVEVSKRYENEFLNVVLQENLFFQINEIIKDNNICKISIENQYVSVYMLNNLKKELKNIEIILEKDAGKIVCDMRKIKSSVEKEKILAAQKITDDAFEYILSRIKEGKTEKELALELEFFMRSNGADAASFDIIFIGGKNTSMPHGVPSDYKLQKGDFVTMDFGADVCGYKSDMTRTVALGFVSEEQKKVYDTVLKAQISALEKIRVGKKCSEIDKTARDIIKDAGYGSYFGHALGHSVGLDIHESPNFSPKCSDILESGMILTVEPGIYIPEKFGVRIEDIVLITENGIENLTKSDKSLIII